MSIDLGPRLGGGDLDTLRHVLSLDLKGEAAEFGVATGTTLALIAQHMFVTGFDSFDGLPEDWRAGFPAGRFRCTPPGPVPNSALVIGLFADTLPVWVPTVEHPLGLVHVDCDLYSSTVTVLDSVYPLLDAGTVIVFDEFHGYDGCEQHEQRAWTEFLVAHSDIDVEPLGHSREQYAVRVL